MADSLVKKLEAEAGQLREQIGRRLPRGEAWIRTATPTAIRRFALAMGDDNPLWIDPDYGRASRYGGQIAPPYFIQAAEETAVCPFLYSYPGFYLGATARFYEPVRAGTAIITESYLADITTRISSRGDLLVIMRQTINYWDEYEDRLLASVDHLASRSASLGPPPQAPRLHQPAGGLDAEPPPRFGRHGAGARAIDDIALGETIGPLSYGPLTTVTLAGKLVQLGQADAATIDMARLHAESRRAGVPPRYPPDETGFIAHPARAHLDERLAQARNLPGPFDYGQARQMWAARLFTDWVGDDGWLHELELQHRQPVFVGETLHFLAIVREKTEVRGHPAIRAELIVRGGDGLMKSKGSAIVLLSSGRIARPGSNHSSCRVARS